MNSVFEDDTHKQKAYLHFISNGGQQLLVKVFKKNLHLANKRDTFDTFCSRCVEFAQKVGIHAIFLDEIHQLQELLQGQFMHSDLPEGNDVASLVCLNTYEV